MPGSSDLPVDVILGDVTLREHGQNVPAASLVRFPPSLAVEVARHLVAAGVRRLEIFSSVSPRRAPAMAPERIRQIAQGLGSVPGLVLVTLVPNRRRFESFLELGLGAPPQGLGHHLGIFLSAVDAHNRLNLGQGTSESLAECRLVAKEARARDVPLVAYVSAALGFAPVPGERIDASRDQVIALVETLCELGSATVTLSDLQGLCSPAETRDRLGEILVRLGRDATSYLGYHPHHQHPEEGVALAKAALDAGLRLFDGSLRAAGGCVTGAPGNAPTEGLLAMLTAAGARTGIDAVALGRASEAFSRALL